MKMASELAHNMLKVTSIFSLFSVRRGDVLALGSPFKERDSWKRNVEAM